MTGRRVSGIVLLAVGVIGIIVFLLADVIGIGASAGFGYRQIVGAIVGAVVAAIGLFLLVRK